MGISLYEHNRKAYEAASELLSTVGKAAVIHPTGTGKSFIAFKLCEDHPDKTVCWLSPSEYIFRTQMENLRKSMPLTDTIKMARINFLTYARLMTMSEEETAEIQADYIILDEFHRCGANMWGQGVRTMLQTHSTAPVLGLSATAIRYLDNRRDMADELFEGNVASEMSLGEAIVRGILQPPKYVLSVYSYQKDLDKYEKRVLKAKSKAVRDQTGKYLDALRRALDKADGLDQVFAKHMPDSRGKYILFCSNYEHMREMTAHVSEWFAKVDPEPHVYRAYSEDPETSQAFADFKEDSSDHLKLLFCIDMLNEGIHVEDISGVILLRPTVSPIIFKQQIGRALAAGKKKDAVIFDIVLNIENLYSIDTVQEEIDLATAYYHSIGADHLIVQDQFEIIDEVRDCIKLFSQLNDSLTASWNYMYAEAEAYYKENGDLNVPKRYITPSGFSLGSWLGTQRRVYAGKIPGSLTADQIDRLNRIGMQWQSRADASWDKYFKAAKAYKEEHGHLLVKARETYQDINLGSWIRNMRTFRKSGIQRSYLTSDRIKALDELGMVWDIPDYIWEQNYNAAVRYHQEYGNLDVPSGYVDDQGVRLGDWLSRVRSVKNAPEKYPDTPLTDLQEQALDELGMAWGSRHDLQWNRAYQAACRYYKEHGNLNVPVAYVSEDIRLGKWTRRQQDSQKKGKLSEERQKKLEAIGMVWQQADGTRSDGTKVRKGRPRKTAATAEKNVNNVAHIPIAQEENKKELEPTG